MLAYLCSCPAAPFNINLPRLQELVGHPIPLDCEASETGSHLEADDEVLSDQQPAALTGLKERQQVPIGVDLRTHVTYLQVKGRTPLPPC